jgi:deferrochelatase/peroxidase EfeB
MAKLLWQFSKSGQEIAQVNAIYSGFLRPDSRGWLGFHEGVSNLKSNERIETVVIKEKYLENRQDYWTVGGTYMAFLRMSVDLNAWQTVPRHQQEILVGRDKLTGCPIIGIDGNMTPIKDSRCPVSGTLEVIEERN